jgi:hypothetical protein
MAHRPKFANRETLRAELDRFARDENRFPGGEHETRNCTACAYLVVEQFGGHVRGYYHAHNEIASVGETEGGHDFAITPERFLVDPWLFQYYGLSPVLDMDDPAELAEALARYGPEENWQKLPDLRAPPLRETAGRQATKIQGRVTL